MNGHKTTTASATLLIAEAFVREAISLSKRQILQDMQPGPIAPSVTSFSELHDYVDANEYGDLCEDGVYEKVQELEGLTGWNIVDRVQNAVDEWLRDGRPLVQGDAADAGDVCRACGRSWEQVLAAVSPENPDAADEWGTHCNIAGGAGQVATCSEPCAAHAEAHRIGYWLDPRA